SFSRHRSHGDRRRPHRGKPRLLPGAARTTRGRHERELRSRARAIEQRLRRASAHHNAKSAHRTRCRAARIPSTRRRTRVPHGRTGERPRALAPTSGGPECRGPNWPSLWRWFAFGFAGSHRAATGAARVWQRRAPQRSRRARCAGGRAVIVDFGRDVTGCLATAESKEWLCTNGVGGVACGAGSGSRSRRYPRLVVAALAPPVGRALLVSKLDELVHYDGLSRPLFTNRWADGTVDPAGHRNLESFVLDGTTPVWTWRCADALVEKRLWMEPGENTTYAQYSIVRARGPVTLEIAALVNYRDYHGTTEGGWRMTVEGIPGGVRVEAFAGARPFVVLADGADVTAEHEWYYGFDLARERERGLPAREDHLRVATQRAKIEPGRSLTVSLSAESAHWAVSPMRAR